MRSRPGRKPHGSPTPPRREVLGFFKSVVEFFTGVIGMATAALGILGTVAAFALAGSPIDTGVPRRTPPTPPVTPTATPTPSTPTGAGGLEEAVAAECALLAEEIGDLSTSSAASEVLADELLGGSRRRIRGPRAVRGAIAAATGRGTIARRGVRALLSAGGEDGC